MRTYSMRPLKNSSGVILYFPNQHKHEVQQNVSKLQHKNVQNKIIIYEKLTRSQAYLKHMVQVDLMIT